MTGTAQLAMTTRRVSFADQSNPLRVVSKAASTFVWATDLGGGKLRIRVPQTTLQQDVDAAALHMVNR